MRRSTVFVIGMLGAAMLVPAAQASPWNAPAPEYVIWADDFDAYADQAGVDAVYSQIYATKVALDTTTGHTDGQSVHHGQQLTNSQARAYLNLGGKWAASDEFPLVVRFASKINDGGQGVADWWTRQFIELRAYENGVYNSGALQDLIALGFNSSSVDTSRINLRRLSGGWGNYTNTYMTRQGVLERGWTRLAMVLKTSTIEFWVDDANGVLQLDQTLSRVAGLEFDSLVLGSGSSSRADVWWDSLSVHYLPEPAMVGLLALGLPFLRRRRTA